MVIADGPISRGAAQQLARNELAKSIYHPHESVIQWLLNELAKLFNAASGAAPGGWWSVVALAAIVGLVAAIVLVRIGPLARNRPQPDSGLLGAATSMTARAHRDLAGRYAAARDYAGAILEFVRAIAAELEEHSVLTPGPGRTADEFATETGRLLPDLAGELTAAAAAFDEVYYGGRQGTSEGTERLRALDASILTALRRRPAHASAAS